MLNRCSRVRTRASGSSARTSTVSLRASRSGPGGSSNANLAGALVARARTVPVPGGERQPGAVEQAIESVVVGPVEATRADVMHLFEVAGDAFGERAGIDVLWSQVLERRAHGASA
jgi:hypothetical protein